MHPTLGLPRFLPCLLIPLALVACGGSDTPIPHRPEVVPQSVVGRFVSGAIDAYCDAVQTQAAAAGASAPHSDLVTYARHGLTCREAYLQDQAGYDDGLVPADPRILDAIGLRMLWWSLGYGTSYDLARIESELVYDEAAAAACFAELRTRGIDPGALHFVPACRRAFDGTTALGSSCTDDGQCAGDAFCGPVVESDSTCTESVCTARAAVDEPCSPDEDGCTAGDVLGVAACTGGQPVGTCSLTRLEAGLPEGAPCDSVFGEVTRLCSVGLRCFQAEGTAGAVCTAPIPRGGDCAADASSGDAPGTCVAGSVCVSSGAGSSCVAENLSARVGDACGYGTATRCDQLARTYCATDGHCAVIGDGSVGAACRRALSEFDCDAGLRCVAIGDEGTCQLEQQLVGALHEPCVPGVDWTPTCATGLRCAENPSSGTATCEAYPFGAGLRCIMGGDDCASGLDCRFTSSVPPWSGQSRIPVCLAPSADGAYCDADTDCVSGVCNSALHVCGASALGGSCVDDADCASGTCAFPTCKQPVASGEACDSLHPCPSGTFCPASGGGAQLCTPILADGATCTRALECSSLRCNASTGLCEAALAVGSTCVPGLDACGPNACVDSLTTPGSFTCAALPLVTGSGCTADSQCASGICLESASLGGSYCRDPGNVGDECDVDAACTTQRCVWDAPTQTASCGALLPLRAACSADGQCASGVCRRHSNAVASSLTPDGRCGDWADVCFEGENLRGW